MWPANYTSLLLGYKVCCLCLAAATPRRHTGHFSGAVCETTEGKAVRLTLLSSQQSVAPFTHHV